MEVVSAMVNAKKEKMSKILAKIKPSDVQALERKNTPVIVNTIRAMKILFGSSLSVKVSKSKSETKTMI